MQEGLLQGLVQHHKGEAGIQHSVSVLQVGVPLMLEDGNLLDTYVVVGNGLVGGKHTAV